MGAGASAAAELSDAERAKIAELKAMSPEAQQALAVSAMRDVLAEAIVFAVGEGQKESTWAQAIPTNALAVPVPHSGDFSSIAQLAGKIPMVGSTLAGAIMKPVDDVAAAFADCARSVCAHPGTASALLAVAAGLTSEKAIALGTGAGSGSPYMESPYGEFLIEMAQLPMLAALAPVAAEVLQTHALTSAWGACIQGFNGAVAKIPQQATQGLGISEIQLDLAGYVVEQTLATIAMLVSDKEASIRGGAVEGMSESIVKVFGGRGTQVAPEDLVKAVVLVNAGDPRALYFADPLPPKVAVEADLLGVGLGGTPVPTSQMITKGGTVLCAKWASSRSISNNASWLQLGLTARGQETAEGIGRPLEFTRCGCFLAATLPVIIEGEGAVKVMDIANGRIHEGALLGMCSSINGKSSTFKKRGGRDFVFNEDGSVSPAKYKGKLVLGCRLVDGAGKAVALGGSKDKLVVE